MLRIQTSQIPSQTFYCTLDGQYCEISLYWRDIYLYMDLSADNNVICTGAICVNKADIVQSPSPYFKGSLHFFDRLGDSRPHFEGLDDRWLFIFVSESEELPELLQH